MYELIQAGERTYYIDCPSKIGIYKIDDEHICLIDSGNDKDAAKKALRHLEAQAWKLSIVINTHSHADHIGGNAYIQERTGAPCYCAGVDRLIALKPILEPSGLYGGYPCKALRNKFLMAPPSFVQELTAEVLPKGLEVMPVNGHTYAMSAIKTSDDVWFLADSLTSREVLEKYHIAYLYDIAAHINTLERLMELNGKLFIPAHTETMVDVREVARINLEKTYEVIELLRELCANPIGHDELLKAVFDHYGLAMNSIQHVLVGSTIRSYLSYLEDAGKLRHIFEDNRLLWQTV